MHDPLIGTVLNNTHRVEKLLGEGGMGTVYLASHVRLSKQRFALKVLDARLARNREIYERFRREAEIATEIGHPNIVYIVDFYETDDGRPCIVMEYLEGEDLAQRLHHESPLPPDVALDILEQVASALHAVHAKGVVHRDLKPANIFLQPNPRGGVTAKVLDFGISKIRDANTVTATGVIMGTPHYMSPEQGSGDVHEIDHRTDIFALGTISYELLTGQLPFNAPTMPGVITAICTKPHTPVREHVPALPEKVDEVIGRALAKSRDDRYDEADRFIADLRQAIGDLPREPKLPVTLPNTRINTVANEQRKPIPPTRPGMATEAPPTPRRSPWTPILIAILLTAGVSFGAYLFFHDKPISPNNDGTKTAKTAKTPPGTPDASSPSDARAEHQRGARDTSHADAAHPSRPTPKGMVKVPPGTYTVGCQDGARGCFDDEKPPREVHLEAFAIMRHEVTMEQYDICVAEKACPKAGKGRGCNWQRPGREQHPINCVTWNAASAYCAHYGWRLPTETEWEAAARGAKHPDYPWGNDPPTCQRTVMAPNKGKGACGMGHTAKVGSRPTDRSWCGALDMGGNVREWIMSAYTTTRKKKKGQPTSYVNRGGSWQMKKDGFFTSHTRGSDLPQTRRPDLGFRCASYL